MPLLSILSSIPLVAFLHALVVQAYIPALPSNVTQSVGATNTSRLHLQWYANGSEWEDITNQSNNPTPTQGILVHFSEDGAGDETTTTPWIAFVSCDANSTKASPDIDIFTMAKERGAKSAVLYSLYSQTCIISPGHQNLALSVFTTQTSSSSQHIEYQFGQFGPSSEAQYGYFDATMLDDAAKAFNETVASNYPSAPGLLFATVPAYDTNDTGGSVRDSNGTGTSGTGSGGSQNTGIAMIVLYAITGCVSALFFAVIVSGAIRAIRYPERYGPRAADPTLGGGQSRARGLGRAILDTFPVVKFGTSDRQFPHRKDIESGVTDNESAAVHAPDSMQLAQRNSMAERDGQQGVADDEARQESEVSEATDHAGSPPHTNPLEHEASCVPASQHEADAGMPECIGRETCPICIVDFEEGDDLRVLPCEGKHRFHQTCVDPWLLELSGSCPICRQDFHALETLISGEPESETSPDNLHSVTQNRLSRYLRFARRRQRPQSSAGPSAGPSSPPPPAA